MATWFLLIIYLAFVSLGLPDSLLGSAWPVMWQDLGTSMGAAGVVSMTIAAGTIVSSLASGAIVRRLGTGKVTLISCALTAGALLGFSISPSMLWLIIFAIPLGLGGGSVDAALNHYVAENYKAHHMNWLHCFWGVGATMGPIVMSGYLRDNGFWRGGYVAVSIVQFSLVVILFVTLPLWKRVAAKRKDERLKMNETSNLPERESIDSPPTKINILQIKGVKPTLIAFLFYCGVEMTIGLWGASYLVGPRGISAESAARWISLYYAGITLGRLITGFIALEVSNRVLIRYGQIITIVGAIILLLPLPGTFSLIGIILIGLGLAPIYPGLLHETPARFGRDNSAKLMGYQMAVAYTGTTLLPPLFGLLASQISLSLFPIVVFVFLALMLISVEKVNRTLNKLVKGNSL
ncbi:MFS transporter [Paenibacillus pectinilyticus]|uniref:MFS transporter n=1 Tax=Paenibacillus pectinilyticus TaxID=512399 RepID=A0A1C0ZZK0_9BACL|nr:MFS transporter [Paenibacillus pectinilyticus]OCT13567.1 MFS transporter [Paenibacillus pectinilyticus]